jgi:hypothetical protein
MGDRTLGVISDLLSSVASFDSGSDDNDRVGVDRVINQDIRALQARIGDPDYPVGYDAEDEVQSLAVYEGTVDGGTFTLEFVLANGETFTTAAIAFDANAATIEGEIDTAANGTVTGWTDSDVSVSGGDLNSAPVVFTFDGDSVTGANHATIVVDGGSLTGGGSEGAVSVTNEGQTKRTAWAVLRVAEIIASAPPAQGTSDTVTAGYGHVGSPNRISDDAILALAQQAAIEDGNDDVIDAILTAANARQ